MTQRRSFLRRVAGACIVLGGAAALVTGCSGLAEQVGARGHYFGEPQAASDSDGAAPVSNADAAAPERTTDSDASAPATDGDASPTNEASPRVNDSPRDPTAPAH